MTDIRNDEKIICDWVQEGSSVLDLGCGGGELLELLIKEKNIIARGVEIEEQQVRTCISKGLSVVHADIDEGMQDYRDNSVDYIILNRTLQALRYPKVIFDDILRVARFVIVNYPNFAYYKNRFKIMCKGRMPKSKTLPFEWYDTPNIHLFTISDFLRLCKDEQAQIIKYCYLNAYNASIPPICPNFLASYGLFMLSKQFDKK